MQALDCRNLKDLLDSYLCDELSVETNHAVLRHVEQCAACRAEMTARRNLRDTMQRAGRQPRLSDECRLRLREALRAEMLRPQMADDETPAPAPEITIPARREPFYKRLFAWPPSMPLAATLMLVAALGITGWFLFRPAATSAAQLSAALWREAVGDHGYCAAQFAHEEGPVQMAESARSYDPAYAGLDRIAAGGAQGLRLRAAHVCSFAGRSFAHLVYTREGELISLLVTERNASAMNSGTVPDDDGLRAGLQQAIQNDLKVSACQTRRHIVLVVSKLSEKENRMLAERIALPVSRHLRRIEALPVLTDSPVAK
jgi:anti-sigma factor RsiW